MNLKKSIHLFTLAILLTACSPSPTNTAPALPPSPTLTIAPLFTETPPHTATATQRPTATPTPLAPTLEKIPSVCSPLLNVAGTDLSGVVVNPFHPPRLGSDDPHQGVDLAQRLDGDSYALSGLSVQAILPGTVAAVIGERFPYGNALLVETPLDDLPDSWLEDLSLPTPAPTLASPISLTCPQDAGTVHIDSADHGRSLYILYAHMEEPPAFELGDPVTCGLALGAIGDSGNALNPHLHVELRLGPSGATFPGLAHYDTSASADEMANYCLWRASNLFQLLDPMVLLALVE